MQTPSDAAVRMMGAVRLLLGDVKPENLSAGSSIPTDWGLCVKLMNHTRFVSRLLKLTRGTVKPYPVVFQILERNLKPDDLDRKVLLRTSRSVAVLGQWLGSLLQYKEVAESGERAKVELEEAEADLRQAAAVLKQKSAEAKKVQMRTQKLNTRISQLIAASESLPHKQSLARLKEYQTLRLEVEIVSQTHEKLLEKIQDGQQQQDSARTNDRISAGGQLIREQRGRARSGDARRSKQSSEIATAAVHVLEGIKQRHRAQAAMAREQLKRLGRRDQLQKNITSRAIAAAAENDAAALAKLVREQEAHRAIHPDPIDQWEVLSCRDKDGRTPLHYACCHGRYEAAIYLLTTGADAKITDTAGFTAMHFAAAYGRLQVTVLLNQFDKSLIRTTDKRGQTPLHVACQAEPPQPDVVSLLLRLGADINAEDDDAQTAFSLTPHDSQAIHGVLAQHDEDLQRKDEAPVVMQHLEALRAQFDEHEDAFGKLLTSMHFGDETFGAETGGTDSSSEEDDQAGDDDSDRDKDDSDRDHSPQPFLSKAEILRQRAAAALAEQEVEKLESEQEESMANRVDSNRLRMSIFSHVNTSVKQAKAAATAMAESSAETDRSDSSIIDSSPQVDAVVTEPRTLDEWFGEQSNEDGSTLDLLPDRIPNKVLIDAAGSSLGLVEANNLETTAERVAAAARRRKEAAAHPESLMVRYWREKQLDPSVDEKMTYGEWYKLRTRPPTPPMVKMPTLTPSERVALRSVLPPPADVKNKAEKTKVRLKKDKKTGQYVGMEVEQPKNDFYNDVITSKK